MYYYFAASLLYLEYGVCCQTNLEAFLEAAGRLLPEKDYALIERALAVEKGDVILDGRHRVITEWQSFMQALRNQWVMVRAVQFKKDPVSFMRGERGAETAIIEAVSRAQKAADPLEGEKIIDQLRWAKLEEIGQGQFFNLDFLIVYALKLQILKRLERIDSVHGEHTFNEYCSTVSGLR
ncbi:MAG: DUF2764 family protein [Candidatus Omnitrophota bacterium]|jgi:hypothetical protein